MSIEILHNLLGYCSLINMILLLWWWLIFIFAHDQIYRIHSKWFNISVEKFDVIHYSGMGIFKLIIFIFNIVPYIALCIVGY